MLLAVLAACNQQKKDSFNPSKENTTSSETALASAAGQLCGNWISLPYIENIKKTKSIYPFRKAAVPLFIFLNKEELLTSDAIMHGFTAHEGGYDVNIKFDDAQKEFVINGKSDDPTFKNFVGLQRSGSDLEIKYKDKSDRYTRFEADIQNELRRILFDGNYSEKDTSNTITFNNNGDVNFRGYTQYEIIYDFTDEALNFDGIMLENKNQKDLYQFKISGKTLVLQKMIESEEGFKPKGEKIILTKK